MTKELEAFQSKFEDSFLSSAAKQLDKDIDVIQAIKSYRQELVAAANRINVQKQSAAESATEGEKARVGGDSLEEERTEKRVAGSIGTQY